MTLFNRDGWTCQYCGAKLTYVESTIDHVIPRSRGGKTSWKNCVTSCKPCNKKKADRTPEEAEMTLMSNPCIPRGHHFWDFRQSNAWFEGWSAYIH